MIVYPQHVVPTTLFQNPFYLRVFVSLVIYHCSEPPCIYTAFVYLATTKTRDWNCTYTSQPISTLERGGRTRGRRREREPGWSVGVHTKMKTQRHTERKPHRHTYIRSQYKFLKVNYSMSVTQKETFPSLHIYHSG